MCGRFSLTDPEALMDRFEISETRIGPRYNIAPTQDVAVVREDPHLQKNRLDLLHWGLVPSWAKDPSSGSRLINARSETVEQKPSFREAFRSQRCLIPADGFFEWKKLPGGKHPFYFRLQDGEIFAFAGLWERWQAPAGSTLNSCCILTTTPNDMVAKIHDRMPVILPSESYSTWLSPATPAPDLRSLLLPYPSSQMVSFPVSRLVNSVSNDQSGCLEPSDPVETKSLF